MVRRQQLQSELGDDGREPPDAVWAVQEDGQRVVEATLLAEVGVALVLGLQQVGQGQREHLFHLGTGARRGGQARKRKEVGGAMTGVGGGQEGWAWPRVDWKAQMRKEGLGGRRGHDVGGRGQEMVGGAKRGLAGPGEDRAWRWAGPLHEWAGPRWQWLSRKGCGLKKWVEPGIDREI